MTTQGDVMATNHTYVQISEPLFRFSTDALMFAFRYSGEQYALSPVAKMMGLRGGSGKGLSGLDGAAQAGMIRDEVGRLNPNERDCIIARYSVNKDGLQAKINLIPLAASALPTGMHSRRMVDQLVQRYFGKKMAIAELSESFGIERRTMHNRWLDIAKRLRETEDRAGIMIHDRLVSSGLVE